MGGYGAAALASRHDDWVQAARARGAGRNTRGIPVAVLLTLLFLPCATSHSCLSRVLLAGVAALPVGSSTTPGWAGGWLVLACPPAPQQPHDHHLQGGHDTPDGRRDARHARHAGQVHHVLPAQQERHDQHGGHDRVGHLPRQLLSHPAGTCRADQPVWRGRVFFASAAVALPPCVSTSLCCWFCCGYVPVCGMAAVIAPAVAASWMPARARSGTDPALGACLCARV